MLLGYEHGKDGFSPTASGSFQVGLPRDRGHPGLLYHLRVDSARRGSRPRSERTSHPVRNEGRAMSVAPIWTPRILDRLRFRLLLLVIVAACGSRWGVAQTAVPSDQRIIHESWTFKDGAPEGVRAFAQSADGYLWVGAPSGLFRFDGVRFELFRSPSGDQLLSTNVSALFAPATGGHWVGYLFGGFSFLKNGRVTNFAESTTTILGFAQDRNGIVWASAFGSTKRGGLWRFNGSKWQHIGAEWNAPENVATAGFDRDGVLWVLTYSRGRVSVKQLFFLLPGDRQFRKAADDISVGGFTWDADHTVLTTHERNSGEPGSGIQFENPLPAYPILRENSEQILDRANGIWFFPFGRPSVWHHSAGEPLADTVSKASPTSSEVYDINAGDLAKLVDREGSVWIADEPGVHRFSYSPLNKQELPKWPGPFFLLAPDEGGVVWIIAADDAGSSRLYRVADGKTEAPTSQADISNFAYRAPDKTFWFGGSGGLWHMVNGSLARIELPQEMSERAIALTTITQDRSGALWVSFGPVGLYRLKDGVWTKYGGQPNLPTSGVVIEFTDTLGRVWFGCTKSQLAVLEEDRVQTFGPNDGVRVGNVTAIYGRGSEIWIGGEFGLQQFDHGRFHTIHAVDKESLRGISGIVETANGDLWLNGLGGIVHIRRAEILDALKNPAYQASGERFDRRAGLPGLPAQLRQAPTAIEGTDGRLWFTVNNGVVWLDPSQASNKVPPPPVTIQSVSADDKSYGLDQPLRLPARTLNVQISYAAISLLNPEAIRYRYKLRGVDNDWHDVGTSTSVSYRNLAPGSYHFQVNASDANGIWSDKIATEEFTVSPAFYQTNWFRAVCACLFLMLLWAAYWLRVRQLRHEFEVTLEARVGERTRIARELHDTLLQSAHGVLLRFQTVSQLLPERPVEAKDKLDSAIEQTADFITEARDEVQGLRDSTLQGNDLALAISTLGEELAADSASHRPAFRVAVEGQSRDLHPILRDEVYRIAAEALRNAFLHANAKQVEVEIRYDDERFRLRVRDDGKGIDAEVLSAQSREGHYGLPGMRERATIMGAKLTVWSEVDAGTEVEVRVPASIAYATARRRSWLSQAFAAKAKGE